MLESSSTTRTRTSSWSSAAVVQVKTREELLPRRDVGLACPRLCARARRLHLDLVDLAVTLRRRVAKQVLAVQLVGHPGERLSEVFAVADLGISTAGFLGHACQPRVRQVLGERGLQTVHANTRIQRTLTAALHADTVDHHVVAPGAVDDLRRAH